LPDFNKEDAIAIKDKMSKSFKSLSNMPEKTANRMVMTAREVKEKVGEKIKNYGK